MTARKFSAYEAGRNENAKGDGRISTEKEVMLGIHALDANGYKVCFAPAGKPRPTEFASTPGSGYILQS